MKYCYCLLFFGFSIVLRAQQPPLDTRSGYSLEELVAAAQARGASPEEIALLRLQWENPVHESDSGGSGASADSTPEVPVTNAFGVSEAQTPENPKTPIFGASFFNNPKVQLAPAINMATPEDYQLGPGDEIRLEVWGAAVQTYQLALNRDGQISIPGLGPVYVNGMRISAARRKLKNSLSKIYSGLQSSIEAEKVFFSLSLSKARSIIVNIIGQVNVPGTYTLNGFTTPLNALYACGGIQDSGSYRAVALIRNGKKIKTIDLYDYLTLGIAPKILLRDQDILRVPFYTSHVEVQGAVKQPAIFELLPHETAADLLAYAGGFAANAYTEQLALDRIRGMGRELLPITESSYATFKFQNGDVVTARSIGADYSNRVAIEGAVNIPGSFALDEAPSVIQLLEKAGGLQQAALKTAALLYRSADGIENEIIPLDFKSMLTTGEDVPLQANDRVVIYRKSDVVDRKQISVEGEVQNPGQFGHYRGMTLRDAILLSGGFTAAAVPKKISIFTTETNHLGEFDYTLAHRISLGEDFQPEDTENVTLVPGTIVLVNRDPALKNIRYASVSGEVQRPGKYLIKDENYRVSDLIEAAGGLSSKAAENGVYLLRTALPGPQRVSADDLVLNQNQEGYRIPIVFVSGGVEQQIAENSNLPLKASDRLVVESRFSTVGIRGRVLQETAVSYNSAFRLRSYIKAAGGFGIKAKKGKVYVVAQNGKVNATKHFLGLRFYPKVPQGATIYVPEKTERPKRGAQETVALASALATLGFLINALIQ